jgi:hypothetical protein
MSMTEAREPSPETRKLAAEHPDSNVADALRIYELQQEVLRLRRWITWAPLAVFLAATVTALPAYLTYRALAQEKCVERADRVLRHQRDTYLLPKVTWSQIGGCRVTTKFTDNPQAEPYTFDPFTSVVED